jgi:Na+/alanine symporter
MDFIKNILKNVVSNIIAFFISIIIIFFIFTAIVSIISSTDDTSKTIEVKSNSVLLIDDLNIIGDRDLMGEDKGLNWQRKVQ